MGAGSGAREPAASQAAGRASADLYRTFVEDSSEVAVHTVAGVLRWISPAVTGVLGWMPGELVGRPSAGLWHPDDRERAVRLRNQAYGGRSGRGVFRIRTKDGRYLWVETSVRPFAEPDGTVGAVGRFWDVTARIEAEAAHAEIQERFRSTMESSIVGMCLLSPEGAFVMVNRALSELVGRDVARLMTMTWRDLTHGDDVVVDQGLMDEVTAGHIPSYRIRKRFVRPDGTIVWGNQSVSCVRDDDQLVRYFIAQIVDVTSWVRAEDALRRRERELRAIAESSADILIRASPDRRIEYASSAITRILGWEPSEVLGIELTELWHPQDRAEGTASVDAARTEDTMPPVRVRVGCKDGMHRWMESRVISLENADPPAGYVCVLRDVHHEVLAEDALARSELHYRSLVDGASEALVETGLDRRFTWISPAIAAILGWQPAELIGTVITDLVHPDDQERTDELLAGLYAGRDVVPKSGFAVRVLARSGAHRWVSAWGAPVFDDDGSLIRVVGGLQDIDDLVTTRTRLQATLDTEFDPHVVMEAVRDYSGRFEDFVYVQANPAACRYLHTDRAALLGATLREVQPGHLTSGLLDLFLRVVETGEPLRRDDFEYTQELGTRQTVRLDLQVARIADGVSSTWRDVTERHTTAEALAASEEMYRLLTENLYDVVAHVRDGAICWVSPSLATTLGWEPRDWAGHKVVDFVHPDGLAEFEERSAAVNSGEVDMFHERLRAKDDSYHWVEVHAKPFFDQCGGQDGIVASFRVIDAEVAAEAELESRARSDQLTGLINRREALERLEAMTRHTRRTGEETAVLFCDIDELKTINDRFGHSAGDDVIRAVAARIQANMRAGDNAARIGGDELLILLDGVHGMTNAVEIAEKLREKVADVVQASGQALCATMSIGVTLALPGESVDDTIARADEAMYRAKRAGGNRVMPAQLPSRPPRA